MHARAHTTHLQAWPLGVDGLLDAGVQQGQLGAHEHTVAQCPDLGAEAPPGVKRNVKGQFHGQRMRGHMEKERSASEN